MAQTVAVCAEIGYGVLRREARLLVLPFLFATLDVQIPFCTKDFAVSAMVANSQQILVKRTMNGVA
jgi:hypothetical protein